MSSVVRCFLMSSTDDYILIVLARDGGRRLPMPP